MKDVFDMKTGHPHGEPDMLFPEVGGPARAGEARLGAVQARAVDAWERRA